MEEEAIVQEDELLSTRVKGPTRKLFIETKGDNNKVEDFYVEECRRFGSKVSSCVYIFLKYKLPELKITSECLMDRDLLPLDSALKRITFTVTHLNLRSCKISQNGVRLIVDFCCLHPIVSLVLTGNPIRSAGVRILFGLLTDPRCRINFLGLSNTDMDWKVAEELSDTLRNNKTLSGLDVSKNYLGYRGRYIIEEALKQKAKIHSNVQIRFDEAHKNHIVSTNSKDKESGLEEFFVATREAMAGMSNLAKAKIEEAYRSYQTGQPLMDITLTLAEFPDALRKTLLQLKDGLGSGKVIAADWLFENHILISFEGNYMIEEIFNTVTHMMGIVFSIIGAGFLLLKCKTVQEMYGCWTFTMGMLCCYTSSTLFHCFLTSPKCSANCIAGLQKMDYCGIFILIAATYTPLLLVPLGSHPFYSITVLIWVWVLAIVGIVRSLYAVDAADLSTVRPIAIAVGWSGCIVVCPLITNFGFSSIDNILYGGMFYMGGIYFLYMERFYPLYHSAWHLCVIGGTVMHYKAIEYFILHEDMRLAEEPITFYTMTIGGVESLVVSLCEFIQRLYLKYYETLN